MTSKGNRLLVLFFLFFLSIILFCFPFFHPLLDCHCPLLKKIIFALATIRSISMVSLEWQCFFLKGGPTAFLETELHVFQELAKSHLLEIRALDRHIDLPPCPLDHVGIGCVVYFGLGRGSAWCPGAEGENVSSGKLVRSVPLLLPSFSPRTKETSIGCRSNENKKTKKKIRILTK